MALCCTCGFRLTGERAGGGAASGGARPPTRGAQEHAALRVNVVPRHRAATPLAGGSATGAFGLGCRGPPVTASRTTRDQPPPHMPVMHPRCHRRRRRLPDCTSASL